MSAPVRIPTRRSGAPPSSSTYHPHAHLAHPQHSPSPSGPRDLYGYSSPSSAASSYVSPYAGVGSAGSTAYGGSATSLPRVSSPLVRAAVEMSAADGGPAGDGDRRKSGQNRRASLMSESLAKSEHTVVNIGDPDRPRLITCVKHSQGFDWNQEIFLPSHYDHLISADLERKRDPVHDIYLSEEDMQGILPQ